MNTYKLGKLPARPGDISLRFNAYAKNVPQPPKFAGHMALIGTEWGMFGNDQYGDCVWAGAAHETILWNKEAGKNVNMSAANVLCDYAAVTGFDPNKPETDTGTDMQLAASYRKKTGVLDAAGNRHQIAAYLAIDSIVQLKQAIWLFGAAGIGIQFPDSAMKQFHAGKKWSVVHGAQIEGGHYIPGVSYDAKALYVVTWGKVQIVEWSFIKKYMDEAVVYLSDEMLTGGKSLEGFDLVTLQKDLASL